jgi:O-antigen/teichoic acid export membrane protein
MLKYNIMKYFSKSYIKEKWSHSGFQKYFRNTAWMLGSRILSMGISFLATIYIARNLGPSNFGQLSYALSFTGLFGFIASLGTENILFRDLIKYPEKRHSLLGTTFFLKIFAGTITSALCILAAILINENDVSKTLIFILALTFPLSAFSIIFLDFQSRADSKYPSIVSLSITLILNVLKVMIIATGKGIIYLALVLLLETVLSTIFALFIYQTKTKDSIALWRFDKKYAYILLRDSAPLILFSAFSMIYARVDQVLIKNMMNATSVGLYDSAVRVSEVWSFIPGIILAALYPAIVNSKTNSEEIYNVRLGRLAVLLFIIAVSIAIPVTFFAENIINILYGQAFIGGVIVLKIYIWAGIGTFLGILASHYLITENYRKIISFTAFFPMACNVVLNLIWIPLYGIEGAAWATLISYSLTPLSLLLFKPTRTRIRKVYLSLTQN